MTPPAFVADCVARALERACVVVGVRPVTDTVKVVEDGLVGATVDRDALVSVASPVVLPPDVVAALDGLPSTDLVALVAALRRRFPVELVQAPPSARRVGSLDDVAVLEALTRRAERQLQVLGEGDLQVARAARHGDDRQVGVAGQAGRGVGPVEPVRRRPGRRRPAAPVPGTPGGSARRPARAAGPARRGRADRGRGTTGIAPPRSRAAAMVRAKRSVPARGRAPSWIATTSTAPDSISGASARSAAHSEACRVSPPSTIPISASPRCGPRASATSACSPGRTTTRTRRTSGSASASRTDQASTGRSPSGSSTLLVAAPTREPEPAARITTAAGTGGVYGSVFTAVTCRNRCLTRRIYVRRTRKGSHDAERARQQHRGVAAGVPDRRAGAGARRDRAGARAGDRDLPDPGRPRLRARQPRPLREGVGDGQGHRRHEGRASRSSPLPATSTRSTCAAADVWTTTTSRSRPTTSG